MVATHNEVTRLLIDLGAGKDGAGAALLPLVYDELHSLAHQHMRRERRSHTLQTTALIHEAFLRLGGGAAVTWENRGHFLKVAAQAMRRILIDHARARAAARRDGGGEREPLAVNPGLAEPEAGFDLLALEDELGKLAEVDPRMVEVVELRFHAGLSVEETAQALGVSPRTVKYDWRMAKAWLRQRMS